MSIYTIPYNLKFNFIKLDCSLKFYYSIYRTTFFFFILMNQRVSYDIWLLGTDDAVKNYQ